MTLGLGSLGTSQAVTITIIPSTIEASTESKKYQSITLRFIFVMTRTRTFADKTMASYRLITILLFQFLVLGNLLLTFVSVFSPVDGFVVSKKWQPIEEAQNTLVFKSSARISNKEAGK